MAPKAIHILMAEDSLDDVVIAKRAFKKVDFENNLYIVPSGEDVLDYLQRRGPVYKDKVKSPRPDLIILDVNMPKMSGIDALKHIKLDRTLKNIPVIMFTISRREEDIVESYQSGCNSYIQKPKDFDEFVEMIKEIGYYWGKLNVCCPSSSN